jgi:hypothetical protein
MGFREDYLVATGEYVQGLHSLGGSFRTLGTSSFRADSKLFSSDTFSFGFGLVVCLDCEAGAVISFKLSPSSDATTFIVKSSVMQRKDPSNVSNPHLAHKQAILVSTNSEADFSTVCGG